MRIANWIDRRLAGRQRTTLSVVGLVTVLAVLAGAVTVSWWLRAGTLTDQRTRLDDLAVVLAQHAGRTIESVDLALAVLSERIGLEPSAERDDADELHDLLRDHIVGLPHIRSMLFFNAKGEIRGDSELVPPRPINVADRAYFQHHKATVGRALYLGVPVWSRVSGQWTMIASRRVQAADGTFLGIVAAGIDPGVFSDLYRGLALGETSRMTLVRTDGLVMARHPLADQVLAEPVASAETDATQVLSVTRQVARYPLSVLISMPLSAALIGWHHQLSVIIGATAAILLFVGLIGFVLGDQSERLEATVAALGAARDEAVRARIREEDAGRAKSAFLANTSHELRTPLNAILGFSEVLRDGHAGALAPKHRDYAANIHVAGTHLLNLISDLLDMAKIEARELTLRELVVDIAEIVADCIRLTERRSDDRGQVVTVRIHGPAIRVRGDARRLRQVVINLLSNAIKFTPIGGRISVYATVAADGRPTVVVADTGIGMSPEDIKIALTPFRQVESPFTRDHEGTGLGLPIVQALVELHGGEMHIESQRDVGTTITVTLPASRAISSQLVEVRMAAG